MIYCHVRHLNTHNNTLHNLYVQTYYIIVDTKQNLSINIYAQH